MAAEIRIRCFLENAAQESEVSTTQSRTSGRADAEAGAGSLAALLARLEADPGEYLVKVVVHRKLDPGERSARLEAA